MTSAKKILLSCELGAGFVNRAEAFAKESPRNRSIAS